MPHASKAVGTETMVIEISMQVSPSVQVSLRQGEADTSASAEILAVVTELGLELKPVHPGTADPLLTRYFVIEVEDSTTAGRALARLQGCEGIEAAYVKPPDAPP